MVHFRRLFAKMDEEDVLNLDYEEDDSVEPGSETLEVARGDEEDKVPPTINQNIDRFNKSLAELMTLGEKVVVIDNLFHKTMSERQKESIRSHCNKLVRLVRDSWGEFQASQACGATGSAHLFWGDIAETMQLLSGIGILSAAELEIFVANKEATDESLQSLCDLLNCEQERLVKQVTDLKNCAEVISELCKIGQCSMSELPTVFQTLLETRSDGSNK